ncbi:MAG: tetratricopeptide repeat protein [Thermodesulfovibrionales bacterium]
MVEAIGRMMKYVPCLCLLIASCATAPGADKRKQADGYYDLGLSYFQEGKYQDAYVALQKSLELDPRRKEVLYVIGLVHMKFEDFDKAEERFREAIDIDRDYAEAHTGLGNIYARQKRWDEAIAEFQEALRNPLYREPEVAYYNLGVAYFRTEKYALAVKSYRDGLRRAPQMYNVHYYVALAFNALGNYGEAADSLSAGISYDPQILGDRQKAFDVFRARMDLATDEGERRDYKYLIEMLNY